MCCGERRGVRRGNVRVENYKPPAADAARSVSEDQSGLLGRVQIVPYVEVHVISWGMRLEYQIFVSDRVYIF